jgi:hypothetical protein
VVSPEKKRSDVLLKRSINQKFWNVTNGTSLRPTTPTHQSTWDSKD